MRFICILFLLHQFAWSETTVPTPADPNNVHGSNDSGIGNGGHDNGVNGTLKPPKTVSVLPLDQVPTSTNPGYFSSWHGNAIAPGRAEASDKTWVTTEFGNMHYDQKVIPWSKMQFTTPTTCSAIVLVNGWDCDDKVDLSGSVTINGGTPIKVSGWHWKTALVVPVPVGTAVSEVLYTADTVPGGDSSGVKQIYLW